MENSNVGMRVMLEVWSGKVSRREPRPVLPLIGPPPCDACSFFLTEFVSVSIQIPIRLSLASSEVSCPDVPLPLHVSAPSAVLALGRPLLLLFRLVLAARFASRVPDWCCCLQLAGVLDPSTDIDTPTKRECVTNWGKSIQRSDKRGGAFHPQLQLGKEFCHCSFHSPRGFRVGSCKSCYDVLCWKG